MLMKFALLLLLLLLHTCMYVSERKVNNNNKKKNLLCQILEKFSWPSSDAPSISCVIAPNALTNYPR